MISDKDRCLICGRFLGTESGIYHSSCIKRFYGTPDFQSQIPPVTELVENLEDRSVLVNLSGKRKSWNAKGGNRQYYFNFPGDIPYASEISDLHMLTAKQFGVGAAETALFVFSDEEAPVQVVRRPAKYKKLNGDYKTFNEDGRDLANLGDWIRQNSSNPGVDVIRFYQRVLYSLLTSTVIRAKDVQIMRLEEGINILAPAFRFPTYDLSKDVLDLDLSICGNSHRAGQAQLLELADYWNIHSKATTAIFEGFKNRRASYSTAVASSLLPDWLQEQLNGRFIQANLKLGLM